ncbi:hypothetical protein ACSUEI_26465, partial [Serratia marcescens]|uniref:hypothetical protein n=1 Tax=Serratia marcescens TaxID=615 RepID=UPI003F4294BB
INGAIELSIKQIRESKWQNKEVNNARNDNQSCVTILNELDSSKIVRFKLAINERLERLVDYAEKEHNDRG